MINTNFNIGYTINRDKLYKLLIQNFDSSRFKFENLIHAGVYIRFDNINIFIFEKGSIIIIVNDIEKII